MTSSEEIPGHKSASHRALLPFGFSNRAKYEGPSRDQTAAGRVFNIRLKNQEISAKISRILRKY
jgi:hypothetical protein